MLIFFDESFRESGSGHSLGVLYGIAIPEDMFGQIIADVYSMKYSNFGELFAKERELKGALLLKRKNFASADGGAKTALDFVEDILRYIVRQELATFGAVCFDTALKTFRCDDPRRIDPTYRAIFRRIDGYMTREFPNRFAKLIFDDVDYGTNLARSTSITNYFNRTSIGQGYDRIIRTPFSAVSQAQNVGLQLADIVTTVLGLRFAGDVRAKRFWPILRRTIYRYDEGTKRISSLCVFKNQA